MDFSGKDTSPLVHGSTDCSFLSWQGLLSTNGDAAARESSNALAPANPWENVPRPHSPARWTCRRKGAGLRSAPSAWGCWCRWSPVSKCCTPRSTWLWAHSWRAARLQHVLLLTEFLEGKACVFGSFRSSKLWLKSKRRKSGQRTRNSPR